MEHNLLLDVWPVRAGPVLLNVLEPVPSSTSSCLNIEGRVRKVGRLGQDCLLHCRSLEVVTSVSLCLCFSGREFVVNL